MNSITQLGADTPITEDFYYGGNKASGFIRAILAKKENRPDFNIKKPKEISKYIASRNIDKKILDNLKYIRGLTPGSGVYRGKGGLQTASQKPPPKAFFQAAKFAYEKPPNQIAGDLKLFVDTPTLDAYIDTQSNSILIGLRGTEITSGKDLKADASLIANNLRNTQRYKTDKATMEKIIQQYPPDTFNYYLSGHSLASAIVTQFKRDFPFIIYGKAFNGAFQPQDLINQDPNVSRLYTPTDFLYNLGGRFFRNVQLVPEKQPTGFFARLKHKLIPSGIRGHFISNFEPLYGGGSSREVEIRKVIKKIMKLRGKGNPIPHDDPEPDSDPDDLEDDDADSVASIDWENITIDELDDLFYYVLDQLDTEDASVESVLENVATDLSESGATQAQINTIIDFLSERLLEISLVLE